MIRVWLITPRLGISNSNKYLKYYARSISDTYLEDMNVRVYWDTTKFVIKNRNISLANAWTEFNLDLTPYLGKNIEIAFQCVFVDKNSLIMDDISLNPFKLKTVIEFALTKSANVKLAVFNAKGELVKTIFQGRLPSGTPVDYLELIKTLS